VSINTPGGSCGTDEFTYTLTDGDGDSSQANLSFECADDTPIIVTPGPLTVDETNLGPVTVSDTITADFGHDGPGTFSANNGFSSSVPLTSGGEAVTVILSG